MADCKEQWVKNMHARDLAPNTIRLYSRTYDFVLAELGEPIDLTKEQIAAWVDEIAQRVKPSTTSNYISGLRSFYRWSVRTSLRDDDPTLILEPPKRRKGIPKPVNDLEATLERLDAEDIRANERSGSHRQRRVGQTRDIATFLVETGLRISEGCSVKFLGPAPDKFLVVGKGRKEALVFLTDKARDAIDRLGGSFGLTPRAIQRRFERADFHPHQLRHTFATRLVQNGVEIGTVSKLCRHSSPATTMVYAQYAEDQMREALARVGTVLQ